jgi:hypothetical protein
LVSVSTEVASLKSLTSLSSAIWLSPTGSQILDCRETRISSRGRNIAIRIPDWGWECKRPEYTTYRPL